MNNRLAYHNTAMKLVEELQQNSRGLPEYSIKNMLECCDEFDNLCPVINQMFKSKKIEIFDKPGNIKIGYS